MSAALTDLIGRQASGILVPFNRQMAALVLESESVRANDLERVVVLPPEGPLGDYPPAWPRARHGESPPRRSTFRSALCANTE